MINSRDLNAWRRAQRQLIPALPLNEFMQHRGSRPPLQGAGVRRRARAAVPKPSPEVPEQEEEEEEEEREVGHHVSYGASSNQERDQRISGWAGSVASAGAGDPDVGVENDEASVDGSSPSQSGVADAHDEVDEDDKTDDNEAPAGQVVPSIETKNARASAQANTGAAVPAQRPSQTLRRSARLRQNAEDTHVSIARIDDVRFDPVAHLRKSGTYLDYFPGGHAEAFVESNTNANATFKRIRQAFLDSPRPDNIKPFKAGNLKKLSLVFATHGAPIKTSEGLRVPANASLGASEQNGAIEYFATPGAPVKTSEGLRPPLNACLDASEQNRPIEYFAIPGAPIKSSAGLRLPDNAFLGASKQNADIQYFDRDDPYNHGRSPIDTSASSSNDAVGDNFPICTLKYGGSSSPDENSSCASSSCPCHDVITLRHSRRYGNPGPGDAWRYRPFEYPITASSPSEFESYSDRDYFAHEQLNLDYGSETHEDRDFFPMQTCVLDYDGDGQLEGKSASEAGVSAHDSDGADGDDEAGSASGYSPSADENNAGQDESGDEGGSGNDGREDAGSASGDSCLADESAAGQEDSEDDDSEGEDQEVKSEPSDSGSNNSGEDIESDESVRGSEDEDVSTVKAENEYEDNIDDESSSNSAANNTTILPKMNYDPLGRIRPPGTPLSPPQPITHPDPLFCTPQTHNTAAPDMTMRPSIDSAAMAAANALAGYDLFNSGIRPPPRPAFRPREGVRLARRGGMPEIPFAGPQTRQNTAPNKMRVDSLAPGQGYVSVSIAEQQSAQMLLAHEGVETVEGEGRESEGTEDGGAEEGSAEDEDSEGEKNNTLVACSKYDMEKHF